MFFFLPEGAFCLRGFGPEGIFAGCFLPEGGFGQRGVLVGGGFCPEGDFTCSRTSLENELSSCPF